MMTNLLNIFCIIPELSKDKKQSTSSEKTPEEIERRMIETQPSEKELNEFMTKETNEAEKADLIKTGKKYQNFFALNPGKLIFWQNIA